MIDIENSRRICAAATPGHWEADNGEGYSIWSIWASPQRLIAQVVGDSAETDANAEFIAHARTALPEALDEIERLREHVAKLRDMQSHGAGA